MTERLKNKFKMFYEKVQNFKSFSFNYLKIRDKKGDIVPFNLNQAQKKIYNKYEELKKQNKPIRFIILKARQEGVSTLFEGLIFQRNSFEGNRKAVIIGHEQEASNNLFAMFKRFYEHLPEPIKPILEHSNEKKLSYKKLKSEIKVYSAESGEKVGRSSTNQDIHCTELGFWRDAKASMLALLQTVPDKPNTMVVIESTANGIGGWFYDTWQDAVNRRNDFIPIFLAWFDLPEYSKKLENEEILAVNTLTDYEKDLQRRYNLTLEQLNWRRYTLRNKCNSDIDLFNQEYPDCPETAFITTGRPVFDINVCLQNKEKARKPIFQGYLEPIYNTTDKKYQELINKGKSSYYDLKDLVIGIKKVSNPKGYVKIYNQIERNRLDKYRYASGADISEGLEQGDYTCIKVLDRKTMNVCITWHGLNDPDLVSEEQHKIQLLLGGDVWFATELNNHGITVVNSAYHLGVNQYFRESFEKGMIEERDKLGFKTTSVTRPIILNDLKEFVREGLYTDPEREFWGECLTFVKNPKGKEQAQGKDKNPGTKCYDDRVFASAIMLRCHQWLPPYKRVEVDERPQWLKEMGKRKKKTRQQSYMAV